MGLQDKSVETRFLLSTPQPVPISVAQREKFTPQLLFPRLR